jgi:hypothetical protein
MRMTRPEPETSANGPLQAATRRKAHKHGLLVLMLMIAALAGTIIFALLVRIG